MSTGFPTYSGSAKQGNRGVRLVSGIVSDNFEWLFRQIHQEEDFGIDGHIEVVTPAGAVTGRMIAAQIKFGPSFFKEQNRWGYVYRGEKKHFNYLANYPIPVIICICEPKSKKCYWVHFEANKTEFTGTNWKLTVPFENVLSESKEALETLVPPVSDHLNKLQPHWAFNKSVSESAAIIYCFDVDDIQSRDVSRPRALFDRLRVTKELAHACQGKVEFVFSGYDDDPRELFEIPEVRNYVSLLDSKLPELFFFVRREEPTCTLQVFMLCQNDAQCRDDGPVPGGTRKVEINYLKFGEFLERHWPAFNEMTDWLGMPYDENKKIGLAVLKVLGLELPRSDRA